MQQGRKPDDEWMRIGMKRRIGKIIVLAAAVLLGQSSLVLAQETPVPSRAAWIEPIDTAAPWIDTRPQTFTVSSPEVLATGSSTALVRLSDGQLYAADRSANILGAVALPEGTVWFAMDEQDRIFAHDGSRLWSASGWQDASRPEGFAPVLDIPDVRHIDVAGGMLVYADGKDLSIVSLETGTVKRISLSDFFDDAKIAAMTPEAVQKAEEEAQKPSKKKRSSAKSAPVPQENESQQVSDIQGVWWRSDGVGVIRVRSLLVQRTFITRDNGRSWQIMEDAPKEIMHRFGWIWNGEDLVLDKTSGKWVRVCGKPVNPAEFWTIGHRRENLQMPPGNWISLEIPEVKAASPENEGQENAPEPASSDACTEVPMIPGATTGLPSDIWAKHDKLYAPEMTESGMAIGLYPDICPADASCPDSGNAKGWMIKPEGGVESLEFPEGCSPKYAAAVHGLGLVMCEAPNSEVTIFVRTADKNWVAETILPDYFADNPSILMAEDGTLSLIGPCEDETVEVPVTVENEESSVQGTTETVTRHICHTALRMPLDLGQPEIWRLENIEDAEEYLPISGGRLISVEGKQGAERHLTLRTPEKTETLVEQFDPAPYHGLVMTREGCLALYDKGDSVQSLREYTSSPAMESGEGQETPAPSIKLLSTEGRLSELDCASSRSLAEMGNQDPELTEKFGDDRYGLRVGVGGFFAMRNVQTWTVRVEGLFPIYRGQYEVGLMYRMAGGNESSALGHIGLVSIRWRYDGLEHFDFAVGAGIGYGTMCGYHKSADKGARDDDESTKPSGFAECSHGSMRYLISGIATYKMSQHVKLFLGAELIGGMAWGFDLSGGLEIRF